MAKRDYYEVLGISKSASADDIKRAYRKLAMKHHPDKHGGDDTQIKEINEAYETLKDSQKRQAYDQFGHSGGPFGGAGGPGGGNPFGAGFDPNNFDFSQFQGAAGFGDIFDMFFQQGGRQGAQKQQRRGADLEVGLVLDFKEAVFGTERTIKFQAEDRCDRCEGKGAEPGTKLKTCPTCKGAGQVTHVQRTILGSIQQTAVCHTCHGEGQVPEEKCSRCKGKGTLKVQRELSVKIPAGVDDGMTIRLSGKGGADSKGPSGDLYVQLRVKADPKFTRSGQTISSQVSIPFTMAALGGQVEVETVDGPVTLKIPAGTQSAKLFKLSERGVPSAGRSKRGDHMVTVNVEIPTRLSAKQKKLLEEFDAEGDSKKRFW